jgi:hypothetical protein
MKIRLLLCIFVLLIQLCSGQTLIPPGDVSGTWETSLSPYHIEGDITIPDDSTLIIQPGVKIIFLGHYAMNVQGRLLAVGTESDTIRFTVIDTTGFSNPDTTLGSWNGIRFIDTPAENDSSFIMYCRLQYGKAVGNVWHINTGGAICVINFDKIRISNCLINHNIAGGLMESPSGGALHLAFSDIKLTGNTFAHNYAKSGGGAVHFHESNPTFVNNTFINNRAIRGGAILIDGLSLPTFSYDQIINNSAENHGGGILFGEPSVVVCNGLTISQNTAQWGGGIGTSGGELHITDCTISENRAEIWGGGVAGDFATLFLNNSTFIHNTSGWGSGALHTDHAIAEITGCDFIENSAVFGGGFHCVYSQANFGRCNFSGNSANDAGGMHVENSNLGIDSCLFDGNTVQTSKAAIEFRADSLIWFSLYNLDITNTIFANNFSPEIVAGVHIEQTDTANSLINVQLDNCDFIANNANRVTAMRIFGKIENFLVSNCIFTANTSTIQNAGVQFVSKCSGKMENCLFTFNKGGASVTINQEADVEIVNCTFANNKANGVAGLSLRRGGKVLLTNSIFWGNSAFQIKLMTAADLGSEILVNHCDIQEGKDSIQVSDSLSTLNWGSGNINLDPQFVDTSAADFHLQDTSPCIGAGINCLKIDEFWHCAPILDLEGNVRPSPDESNSDMGAYEHPLNIPTSVAKNNEQIPEQFALFDNYPNPFNPSTSIDFTLPNPEYTTLKIYNILGAEVAMLVSDKLNAGRHSFRFDGNKLASGVYYYQVNAGEFWDVKKMVLLR